MCNEIEVHNTVLMDNTNSNNMATVCVQLLMSLHSYSMDNYKAHNYIAIWLLYVQSEYLNCVHSLQR